MIGQTGKLLSSLWWGMEALHLDQSIFERKEENHKLLTKTLHHQRHQLIVRTIRERRVTGVNHDPFPEGAFDQLERNNIWKKVLGYLSEPSDVTSAYFACGTFAKILKERRQVLMMPKVLNIFKGITDEAYNCRDYKTGYQCYRNYKAILLKARSVSKGWKEVADFHLFENHPIKVGFFNLFPQIERRIMSTPVRFTDEKSVDRMISLLSQNQASMTSSIICNVVVDIRLISNGATARDLPAFFRKLMEFLRVHGTSVSFFNFDCGLSSLLRAGDVYLELCEILESMPNLKGFSLNFGIGFGLLYPEQQRDGGVWGSFLEKVNQRPFPSLVSLEHFCCYGGGSVEESLFSLILRKCRNLRSVDLPYIIDRQVVEEVAEALQPMALETLAGLTIRFFTSSLYQLPWPLKRLEIKDALKASVLFPLINRFRTTLQELTISGCNGVNSSYIRLDLPHLKVFQTSSRNSIINSILWPGVTFSFIGFDHLLPLKSLEKVVVLDFEIDEDENAIVKVKRYVDSDEMDKSNVWQCFPNLKFLRLRSQDGWFHPPTSP